ncbi:Putative GntR-family transcriptional regulator [Frankia alni ACN14a]|uniref:GntR-family transcriptional regulator n=1 Tax=Frankia alni (strain DSM 45986 / CECT 9034 / ACN14a) TaxID=326424 RepID=Q0RAY9_FRAAA|nr:Putative GntR-family transcriptional regulator [Frankia alni ACN14a]
MRPWTTNLSPTDADIMAVNLPAVVVTDGMHLRYLRNTAAGARPARSPIGRRSRGRVRPVRTDLRRSRLVEAGRRPVVGRGGTARAAGITGTAGGWGSPSGHTRRRRRIVRPTPGMSGGGPFALRRPTCDEIGDSGFPVVNLRVSPPWKAITRSPPVSRLGPLCDPA